MSIALVNRKQVTISLPPDINEWLEKQAEKECRPKGRLVEWLIREYQKEIETKENKKN